MEGIDDETWGKFRVCAETRARRAASHQRMQKWPLALLVFPALALLAQTRPVPELKHLTVPTTTSVRPVSITAFEVVREGVYPAVIHLKGSVEIKTPLCLDVGPGSRQACGGYMVLHADEADFRENSGQIDARGSVKVTREQ